MQVIHTLLDQDMFYAKQEVYKYIDKIIPLRKIDMNYLSFVEQDNQFYNFPMHYNDIKKMPDKKKIKSELKNRNLIKIKNSKNLEEYWINSVGKTLYGKFVEKYNKKMWQVSNNKKIDTFGWSPKGATMKSGPKKFGKHQYVHIQLSIMVIMIFLIKFINIKILK